MSGRDRRRFNRLPVALPVLLRRGNREERLVTADVSRHGAFILTDHPSKERELVQLRFEPKLGGPIDVMCMVTRSLPPGTTSELGPGMGVDFFALSRELKNRWDRFVIDMEHVQDLGDEPVDLDAIAVGSAGPLPPPLPLDALDDEDGPLLIVGTPMDSAPIRRAHPRHEACFLVRLSDKEQIETFRTRDVSRGGMFLQSPLLREPGDDVTLILIHPETDEGPDEFELEGMVVRIDDDPDNRGMAIRFENLDDELRLQLNAFLESGVRALEVEARPAVKDVHAAEDRVREMPDGPEELEELGRARLRDGDLAGAVDALTRAVVHAPSMTTVHEKLAEAYYLLGDAALARAHERVALALNLYRTDVDNALV